MKTNILDYLYDYIDYLTEHYGVISPSDKTPLGSVTYGSYMRNLYTLIGNYRKSGKHEEDIEKLKNAIEFIKFAKETIRKNVCEMNYKKIMIYLSEHDFDIDSTNEKIIAGKTAREYYNQERLYYYGDLDQKDETRINLFPKLNYLVEKGLIVKEAKRRTFITVQFIDYLRRNGYLITQDDSNRFKFMGVDCSYYSYLNGEKLAVQEILKKNKEERTYIENNRVFNYQRIIDEIASHKDENYSKRHENAIAAGAATDYINLRKEYTDYIRKIGGTPKYDDDTPIGQTTMGHFRKSFKLHISTLDPNSTLYKESIETLNLIDRIVDEVNIQRFQTELGEYFIYLVSHGFYISYNDKTPIGNTTMGIYGHTLDLAMAKLIEKEKDPEQELSNYDKKRLKYYNELMDRINNREPQIRLS